MAKYIACVIWFYRIGDTLECKHQSALQTRQRETEPVFAFQTKLSEHSNGAGSSVKQPQPSVLPKVVTAYVFVLFIHSDLNKGQTFETDFVEILRIFLTSSLNLFHVILINSNHQLLFLGAVSIRKTVLPGMAIPMLKIRRPNGRLIFNMEIAIRR